MTDAQDPTMSHRLPPDHPAYAPRRSTLPITRLYCRAPARETKRLGNPCGAFLADVPGVAHFITTARHAPPNPDGTIWAKCSSCGAVNRYEIDPLEPTPAPATAE